MALRGSLAGLLCAASAITLAACSGGAGETSADLVGKRVDNFMLTDQTGFGHELGYHSAAPAVVLVSYKVGDADSERAAAALAELNDKYAEQGVQMMLLASSNDDDRAAIQEASAELDIPVLDDSLQLVGRSLGVTKANEAFVIRPSDWTIAYHGPIDASFARGDTDASVAAAIDSLLAGEAVAVAHADVKGAAIEFPDRARAEEFAQISYSEDVAPILAEKCMACHVEGGMAPFAMTNYDVVKGFSPMIREALRTQRMPPYHADPEYGHWEGDMRLTGDEIRTVVNWIEAGSPRGEGDDMLAMQDFTPPEWPFGEPDLILTIPATDVPASGVVDYIDWSIPNPHTEEGKWVKAVAWKPSAPEVLHHALSGWFPEVRADGKGFSWNTALGGYGPGGEENLTPENTGIYVPAGGSYTFQMHYTTTGKAQTDETKVGIYFHDEAPEKILRQAQVADFSLEIPAGEARHHETAYIDIPHDMTIFGTQPHAHYRAISSKLRIQYPDGREEVLLNQPRYDFGWQREYHFEGQLKVPAGSRLIADYVYDNSEANPWNPDAAQNVTYGEQSWEEMMVTFIRYSWDDETKDALKEEYQDQLQAGILFGALDDNRDEELQQAEFRNASNLAIMKQNFALLDQDGNGGASRAEFQAAQDFLRNMRQRGGTSGGEQ